MRPRALALLAAVCLVACSTDAPTAPYPPLGPSYRVATIGGRAVPGMVYDAGDSSTVTVDSATLHLDGGRFTLRADMTDEIPVRLRNHHTAQLVGTVSDVGREVTLYVDTASFDGGPVTGVGPIRGTLEDDTLRLDFHGWYWTEMPDGVYVLVAS